MVSALSAPHFHNEEAAFAYVEARVWPEGPICPHCGGVERIGKMGGKSTRLGLYKCYQCRKPFTVRIGTIFESSHVALHIWLQAMYLIAGSKKGISSNQLHRTLGVTLKTAWFMSHRIREAMKSDTLGDFGAGGGAVEMDETFIGQDPDAPPSRMATRMKMQVVALIDRTTGRSTSMVYTGNLNVAGVTEILRANVSPEAHLMTDEARFYRIPGKEFAAHSRVIHARGEYVSKFDPNAHTNTIEGFFSIFKRGMKGVYQHCQKKHLHRYLAEFDFRYSNRQALGCNDADRADRLLAGVVGKRLTYETTGRGA
ncbi:IS1595 family transposase [Sphingopyxis soli]|uniref:IS1595 family transposase n=1 Tax=Sphingopyxis soli TaxID=592051 RepID=A0ABN1LYC7_9SPHN|nr:IS1595 family transposase [Sphingopyxis soli]